MTVARDEDLDLSEGRGEDDREEPTGILAEGPGISTAFFWQGQGRPLYRPGAPVAGDDTRDDAGAGLLRSWVEAGIRWIEMEDYTVLRVARLCGLEAATLGAVISHRRRADGSFQTDYDHRALLASELIPAELALSAIVADAREA